MGMERLGAATGAAFAVSAAVAFLIVPDPPSADAGSEFVLNFVATNDSDLLWQAFFFGLSALFLLWFGGTLAIALRQAAVDPTERVSAIVAASVAAATALFLVGISAAGAVASGVEAMDQGVGYGLYQLASFALVMTDFPAAAFVFAASVGIFRTGLLPSSVGWVGSAVALLLLVTAGGRLLADDAEFAPGGSVNTIAFGAFIFWVFVASVFLLQRRPVRRSQPET